MEYRDFCVYWFVVFGFSGVLSLLVFGLLLHMGHGWHPFDPFSFSGASCCNHVLSSNDRFVKTHELIQMHIDMLSDLQDM